MSRTPVFTLAALVTLALGIGGTTAIFSVVNAVLYKPLPYPESDRILVMTRGGAYANMSGRIFHYVRDRVRSFDEVAALGGGAGSNLVIGSEAEYVQTQRVTDDYFELLGIALLVGREFTAVESRPDGPKAVILSEAVWHRHFGGRAEAIGQVVRLGGIPHTVVGVAPSHPHTIDAAEVWAPLQVSRTDDSLNYTVLGRLRADASYAHAQREIETIRSGIVRELGDDAQPGERLFAWTPYQDALAQASRTQLLVLLGAVGFLLLIVCANVASLQFVRGISRRREMAMRSALGAGAGRLARQVLTESLVLGILGGVLGLLVARWGVRSVLALTPEGITFGQSVDLDWRVLLVATTIALGTGLLSGIIPALQPRRLVLRTAMRDSSTWHTVGRRTLWLHHSFVVTEVALAVVLLVGAGLLLRTFAGLRNVPLGFDPEYIITAEMSLQGTGPPPASGSTASFFERTLERIRELPGVEAAAVGNNRPVERGLNLPVAPPPGGIVERATSVDWRYVTPEYFTVFRIPRRNGRLFDERDGVDSARVAIVNEAFGRTYFGRPDVVGEHIRLSRGDQSDRGPPLLEIVGIVADVKSGSGSSWATGENPLAAAAPPILYVPIAQVPEDLLSVAHYFFPASWAIRTRGTDAGLQGAIQNVITSADPTLPVIRFQTMEQVIGEQIEAERFRITLVGGFAAIAMLLAGIGIYGLVSYSVGQRTQEIGVRLAIGAPAVWLLADFLRTGVLLALIGVVLGLVGAILVSQALRSFIWGVEPFDALTYAAVAAVVVVIAAVASFAPAIRAARVNPTHALRLE